MHEKLGTAILTLRIKFSLTNQIHKGTLPPGLIQKDGVGREKQTFILPFQLNKKI